MLHEMYMLHVFYYSYRINMTSTLLISQQIDQLAASLRQRCTLFRTIVLAPDFSPLGSKSTCICLTQAHGAQPTF
jgi:hypothetical protein